MFSYKIYSQSKWNQYAVNRKRHPTSPEYPQIADKQTRSVQTWPRKWKYFRWVETIGSAIPVFRGGCHSCELSIQRIRATVSLTKMNICHPFIVSYVTHKCRPSEMRIFPGFGRKNGEYLSMMAHPHIPHTWQSISTVSCDSILYRIRIDLYTVRCTVIFLTKLE